MTPRLRLRLLGRPRLSRASLNEVSTLLEIDREHADTLLIPNDVHRALGCVLPSHFQQGVCGHRDRHTPALAIKDTYRWGSQLVHTKPYGSTK